MKPCIGCGFCCRQAPCGLGLNLGRKKYTPDDTVCEFLVPHEGRFRCSLYLNGSPGRQAHIAHNLSFGAGCSSSLFNDDREAILELELSAVPKTL